MRLSNKVYDNLKWIVMIFVPAFISLVATVGQVLNGTWVVPVVTILTALNTFLGTILGLSSATYTGGNDGSTENNY